MQSTNVLRATMLKPFVKPYGSFTSVVPSLERMQDMAAVTALPVSTLGTLEDRIGVRQTDQKRFDPTSITAIITAIINLMTGCFKPTPARLRRRPGLRVRLALEIHAEQPGTSIDECIVLADDALFVLAGAKDEELYAFIQEATA
jgi:hypothetical protein